MFATNIRSVKEFGEKSEKLFLTPEAIERRRQRYEKDQQIIKSMNSKEEMDHWYNEVNKPPIKK